MSQAKQKSLPFRDAALRDVADDLPGGGPEFFAKVMAGAKARNVQASWPKMSIARMGMTAARTDAPSMSAPTPSRKSFAPYQPANAPSSRSSFGAALAGIFAGPKILRNTGYIAARPAIGLAPKPAFF